MPETEKKQVLKSLERDFLAGQAVFEEGEQTRELYILLSGTVEIRKNDRVIAVVNESDTYLGEMSTLLGTPRTATIMARTDCKFIRVPENKVSDFFAHSPALGIKLAKVLARRLQEMNIKYERMLAGMAADEGEAKKVFEDLTRSSYRRQMLDHYRRNVGRQASVKETVAHLDIPLSEINRVLLAFADAGLVRIEDRVINFLEAGNRALRRMILDWKP